MTLSKIHPKLADHERLIPRAKARGVLWRANYACERCGDDAALGLYARKTATSQGLDERLCNFVILDVRCVRWLSQNRNAAYVSGYSVVPERDPASVPLDITGLGRRLLTEHGRYFDPATDLVLPAGFRQRSA